MSSDSVSTSNFLSWKKLRTAGAIIERSIVVYFGTLD